MAGLFLNRFQLVTFSAILSLLLIFSLGSSQNADKKICQKQECALAAQNLKKSINFSADPCDDFYLYACGNYPETHKNLNNMPQSTFRERTDENDKEVLGVTSLMKHPVDFIKQNNSNDEPEAVHKAKKFYSLCLNEAAYSNNTAQVENILQRIGLPVRPFLSNEVKDFDFATVLARVTRLAGIKPYFDLGVSPNPFNRTENMIGLSQPLTWFDPDVLFLTRLKSAAATTKEEFLSEVTKRMCNDPALIICREWNSSFNMMDDLNTTVITKQNLGAKEIIDIARPTLNATSLPVIYTLKKLQNWTDGIATELNTTIPKLNWTRYIEEMFTGLDNVTLDLSDPNVIQIVIERVDFVQDMVEFIYKIKSVKRLEYGLWWSVVSTILPYADLRIFDLKTNTSVQDNLTREKFCAAITYKSFDKAVSYVYATKEKYVKAKAEIHKMVEYIRASFAEIIRNATWMDDTTKQKALKKLNSIRSLIVYPNDVKTKTSWNNFYKDVQITDNLFDTLISKTQKQINARLNTLNRVNDLYEDDWIITPIIVDAYYDEPQNSMIIPGAILGGSVYNGSLGALDYGAIGTIIGHELTHALDVRGRRYNDIGNVEDWWQPDTSNIYREKAECFVKAYGNYTITQNGISQQGDSKATLAEDISDNGGFKEALLGYRKYVSVNGEEPLLPQFENFTHDQLFTLSFANVWCENPTSYSSTTNKFDEHSPQGVRVNGVLRNSKEFSEIWKCSKVSKMNQSEDKCSIW